MKFDANKVKKFLGSKVGIGLISLVIGYSLGTSSLVEYEDTISKLKTENTNIKTSIETKDEEITKLASLVDEAKPYFDMKEEEQAKLAEQAEKEKAERLAREEEERKAEEQAKIDAMSVELSNGNYVAGEDFDAGTYDLIAVSGGGNVSSSNMYSGGLNAIMGTANDGFYEKEYKNIKLPAGTTLKISGVTIKLVPKI